MVMISFGEPLYVTALYLRSESNGSILEMTQTDSCANFLDLSAEIMKITHEDGDDTQIITDRLRKYKIFGSVTKPL